MPRLLSLFAAALTTALVVVDSAPAEAEAKYVHGYTRSDGTLVPMEGCARRATAGQVGASPELVQSAE
jgi:hypothetical protein